MINAIIATIFSLISSANSCGGNSTTVLFTNGIISTESEAVGSVTLLKSALSSQSIDQDPKNTEYKLAYNETAGDFNDKLESLDQISLEKFEDFVKGILGDETVQNPIAEEFIRMLSETSPLEQANTDYILTEITSAIKKGNRVLHVGHSQGSLYVNRVYSKLSADQRKYYRAEHVAAVAGSLNDGMDYVSFIEDKAIYWLSYAYISLPGNVSTNSPSTPSPYFFKERDMRNHYFIAYMSHSASQNKFKTDVARLLSNASYPPPQNGKGPITATMTWSGATDVDLHAFEPSGQHVYYANTRGTNGYLDVDNTSGYGPEHYYVTKCEDLSVGTYRFGANYYSGNGAQNVTIRIETPNDQASKNTVLPKANGSAGNSSPSILFNVIVKKDSEGNYTFSIK